jgi:hypothetical protein
VRDLGITSARRVWWDTAERTPEGCWDTQHTDGEQPEGDSQTDRCRGPKAPVTATAGDLLAVAARAVYLGAVPYLNE